MTRYNRSLPDSIRIDWVRLIIPYPYEKVSLKEKSFISQHNNKLVAGVPTPDAYKIQDILFELLAVDSAGKTDLSYFQHWKKAIQHYDTRYRRDGFDLLFNMPSVSDGVVDGQIVKKAYMPVAKLGAGLKLDISGIGCRYMEHALRRDGHDWQWLFWELRHCFPNIKLKRIDLAYDIFHRTRHLNPDYINSRWEKERRYREKMRKGMLPKGAPLHKYIYSRRSHFDLQRSGEIKQGYLTGDTLNIGRSDSELRLRIYDKNAERAFSHGDAWRLSKHRTRYWYRWEVQTTDSVSQKVFNKLADGENGGQIWLNCIRRMFTVLPTPLEKKRYQYTVMPVRKTRKGVKTVLTPIWWDNFMEHSGIDQMGLTVSKARDYFYDTGSRYDQTLSHVLFERCVYMLYKGGDIIAFLQQWLEKGGMQLNGKDIRNIRSQMAIDAEKINKERITASEAVKKWTSTLQDQLSTPIGDLLESVSDEALHKDELADAKRYEACGGINDGYQPATLQRYHDWQNGLPAALQNELNQLKK